MFYNSKQITSRFLLSLLFLFAPLLATAQTTGTPLVIPGIEFKDPYQSSNSTQINIPVKLTLGSTDKSFTNFDVTITDQAATNPTPPFGPSIPPYTGPGPGNTVTVLVTFTGTKNKTYKITGSMNYKDSADKTQNVTATSVTVTVN